MADIGKFLAKRYRQARIQGIRPAVRGATLETAVFCYSRWHEHYHDKGQLIWDDEWDICLVCDATRYDQWTEVSSEHLWLKNQSEWSVGSASPEWYGNTFDPDVLPDELIGLVTANPFAGKPSDRMAELNDATPVHEHIDVCEYVYEDSWGCEIDGEYLDVTHPGVVTDRAHAVWQAHDLDRLVVHYMQPHLPFRAHPEWFGKRDDLDNFGEPETGPYNTQNTEVWKQLQNGEREFDEVWEAYKDNLRWVLDHIDKLRQSVDAEMLITSDHGNGVGEWGVYSHPPNCYLPCVRKVPCVTVSAQRDEAYSPYGEAATGDTQSVDDKLEALGYK